MILAVSVFPAPLSPLITKASPAGRASGVQAGSICCDYAGYEDSTLATSSTRVMAVDNITGM